MTLADYDEEGSPGAAMPIANEQKQQQPPVEASDPYEYAADVYQWRYELQFRFFVPDCLSGAGTLIRPHMRRAVLRWLSDVLREWELSLDTFCMTATLFDAVLCCWPGQLKPWAAQLAGLTAFYVAGKIEEVHQPRIEELVFLCKGCYSPRMFATMERLMLKTLNWRLQAPTAAFFLRFLVETCHRGGGKRPWPELFSRRLVEHCICDYDVSSKSPPSFLGQAVFQVVAGRVDDDARIHVAPGMSPPGEDDIAELLAEYEKGVRNALEADRTLRRYHESLRIMRAGNTEGNH